MHPLVTYRTFSHVRYSPLQFLFAIVIGCCWSMRVACAAKPLAHEPKMSWLDNGTIKLGVDLELGGAITYLSLSGQDENVVNSWDHGRQVQLSFYAPPIPFEVPGKKPKEAWKGLGWNPIQSGDCFGNRSRILEQTNDGKTLYVKCVPMQWPLDNVPGECTFESWLSLDGPVVKARARINNDRKGYTGLATARTQELPAVYTNGSYYKLMTYTGDKPFTDDELVRIEKKKEEKGPWSHWRATEKWAALVNDAGFGLGVRSHGCYQFSGGFAGKPGAGGPNDDPTGYIAPTQNEILDDKIQYEFSYELILGTLAEIRKQVYTRSEKPKPPSFKFTNDRQSWTLHDAYAKAWPVRGKLIVTRGATTNSQLISPPVFYDAADGPVLNLTGAIHWNVSNATVYWATTAEPEFHASRHLTVSCRGGESQLYSWDLSKSPEYKGIVTRLRIDFNQSEPETDEPVFSVQAISLEPQK